MPWTASPTCSWSARRSTAPTWTRSWAASPASASPSAPPATAPPPPRRPMPAALRTLDLGLARRLIVSRQRLAGPPPVAPGPEAIMGVATDLASLQLDPISVVARSRHRLHRGLPDPLAADAPLPLGPLRRQPPAARLAGRQPGPAALDPAPATGQRPPAVTGARGPGRDRLAVERLDGGPQRRAHARPPVDPGPDHGRRPPGTAADLGPGRTLPPIVGPDPPPARARGRPPLRPAGPPGPRRGHRPRHRPQLHRRPLPGPALGPGPPPALGPGRA